MASEEKSAEVAAPKAKGAIVPGSKVVLDKDRNGIVRFVGKVSWETGTWYGIELLNGVGKNDGKRGGKRYFYAGKDRGVFYKRDRIRKVVTSRHRKSVSTQRIYDLVDPSAQLNKKAVKDWDIETVGRWLNEIGCQDAIEPFIANGYDGPKLIKLRPYDMMTKMAIHDEEIRTEIIRQLKVLMEKQPLLAISEEKENENLDSATTASGKLKPKGKKGSKGRTRTESMSAFVCDTPVTTWTANQVCRYINGIGGQVSTYGEVFLSKQINGEKLMMLTEDDLKDLGVDELGVRKKIMNGLMALADSLSG